MPRFPVMLAVALFAASMCVQAFAAEPLPWTSVQCPGEYPHHLQGVCADDAGNIYWCFTTKLVKTSSKGQEIKTIPVANHHGDLCFHNGKIFVAVNLGKFNQPAGKADSWIFEYDAATLSELAKHPVPELVHGAGGMEYHNGKFIVVGGLPEGIEENYLYEYGDDWKFRKRHVLKSGYTKLGIQTIAYSDGHWWLGCYGSPSILLKADEQFNFAGRHEFNCSLGLIGLGDGKFLVAKAPKASPKHHRAELVPASVTPDRSLKLLISNETQKPAQ